MQREMRGFTTTTMGPQPGEMLPLIDLPGSGGDMVSTWRYKGRRNLVLVFVHDEGCDVCLDLLRGFADRYADYTEEETEVLGIAALSPERARQLAERLNLPFPLLADEDGSVHRRYGAVASARNSGAAVYVADRFGEVHERWVDDDGHHRVPAHDELLERLRFIEIQCPECGAPEWPPA